MGLTSGADRFLLDALELNIAERGADIAQLESQGAKASSGSITGSGSGASTGSGGSGGKKPPKTEAETIGEKYAKGFENDFASGLKKAFRDGDIKGFLTGLLDSFTGKVIDSFVDGLTNSLFEGISGEGGILSNFFGGMSETGSKLGKGKAKKPTTEKADGEKAVSGIGGVFENAQSWMSGLFSEGGAISGIFSGFSEGLGGIFSSLGGMLGGMGGGGSGILGALGGMGGGGGLFSSLTGGTFGSFLGFSQGGTVPTTSTSQAGKDSVPAMLMPGEVVLSKSQLANTNNNTQGNQQTINLKIVGNIDKETRRNIIQMMPQIASGVNMNNKENNYKR